MDKLGKRQDGKRNGKGTHTFPDGSSIDVKGDVEWVRA